MPRPFREEKRMKRSLLDTQARQPEIGAGAEDAPQHLERSLLGKQALLARRPRRVVGVGWILP